MGLKVSSYVTTRNGYDTAVGLPIHLIRLNIA